MGIIATLEEKMTQAIRARKSHSAMPGPGAPVPQHGPGRVKPVPVGAKGIIAKAKKHVALFESFLKRHDISLAERLPQIFLAVTFAYLLFGLIYPLFARGMSKPVDLAGLAARPYQAPKVSSLDDQLKDISDNRLFSVVKAESAAQMTADPAGPDLLANLRLVCIISGEKPQVAMEDTARQKTYYAEKGQFINGFRIDEIRDNKIILNFRGKRYELSL